MTRRGPVGHLVLVGLMAVGKTTVGRQLATSLGWPISDSDDDILRREGLTAAEIQARHGRRALHALEARHLLDALAADGPTVICAAASTVDDPTCRLALAREDVVVAWLQGRIPTLATRYSAQAHRPSYAEGVTAALAAQAAERAASFAALAPLEITVDGRAPEAIAREIQRSVDHRVL